MPRHTFTKEECSRGYHTVLNKYAWATKFLRKRMFKSYHKAKVKRQKEEKRQ